MRRKKYSNSCKVITLKLKVLDNVTKKHFKNCFLKIVKYYFLKNHNNNNCWFWESNIAGNGQNREGDLLFTMYL